MKRIYKMMLVGTMILSVTMISKQGMEQVTAASKNTIKLDIKDKFHITEKMFKGAKKLKVSSSKKKVVSAKITKNKKYGKCVLLNAKKKGKATITVKVTKKKKKRTFRYKISVRKKVSLSPIKLSKKAFDIQNDYRRKAGVDKISWSDALYALGLYRLNTSGFDSHKNMERDYKEFWGGYVELFNVTNPVSENLSGVADVSYSCTAWRNSSGHYANMIKKDWKSGAIAYVEDVGMIAIFSKLSPQEIPTYKSMQQTNAKIVVRRQDSATGQYINAYGSTFVIRDMETGEQKAYGFPKNKIEKEIYICLTGRRYRIYETVPPDGYSKAKGQTFTAQAARDGTMYIILTD